MWTSTGRSLEKLGRAFRDPQESLLEALGRASRLFAPIEAALAQATPDAMELDPSAAWALPPAAEDEPSIPNVTLAGLNAPDYDKQRGALPSLHLSFRAPASHGRAAPTRRAVAWTGALSPADLLGPLLEAAAAKARPIALAEPDAEASDEPASERAKQRS